MESITEIILGYFFGLASNLHADAILTAQKKKLIKQLQTDEKAREALRAFCPYAEDVRLACLQLAEKHELLRSSPAAKRLSGLLTDSRFHSDFLEWLQAGDIEEGDAVKARMLKQMEKILGRTAVSNEQLDFLQNDFFTALDKAIFADPILARWRFDLSLRYLREKVAELQRLAKENAGIYSELQQQRVLDLYCQKALDAWDIIDLSNLPEGDLHMATQKFLLRQLYMPLRISFSKASRDPHDDAQLNGLEDVREKRRLIDAGRTDSMDAAELAAMQTAMPVGERLNSCQRLVILGDPGAGKTTMLRWLATAYLLRHIADPALDQIPDVQTLPPQAWIPVLIRCRDIGPKDLCRSFTDVLSIHLSKTELLPDDAKIMGAIILDRIAKGEILLLVDGLDEITDRQDRIMFCEELERMAARYPEAPILVTSRIVGYRDMPYRMRTGFEHGVISDLQAEDKDQFARRWVEVTESYQTRLDRDRSARELIDALHSTVRIERLTGNPMLLTTLALVKRKVGKLPTRRNKLYAEAITVLLNWNPRVYDRIEDDEALPQLAYLAHEMCRRGVQRLTEDDVLDLLDQIRNDYPNIRPVGRRNSQEFLKRIEERSSLLMRSGHVWRPNNPHEKTVWEFRHLTFQEYLAARALLDGRYKDRDKTKTLAAQVAPLAAPAAGKRNNRAEASVDGSDRSNKPASVPDSWREALRLLVSDCKDDDVDDVLQGILQPGAGEDAAISRHPRAVLAAQCLAEEPNVSEEMASQVLEQFVSLLGQEEGIGELTTNLERAALEVWQSSWMGRLQTTLIQAFSEGSADRRANCGGVLAQLLAGGLPGAPADWDDNFEALLSSLQSPDPEQAICAALTVVQ
ncbi:MAG: NACHT domain-containing protein, partial [Cyanobacteriota bacterium]